LRCSSAIYCIIANITKLFAGIEKYNITRENIYNWDEKGFLCGFAHTLKRIMTKEAYDSGRIRGARQDGSREFISLLAAICADGTALPPALIYKGASGDLQDTWVEDVTASDEAFFASSANGWSSNEFGLKYLEQVFQPHTQKKAGRGRRLLIVDGHSSHVNMKFLDMCDRFKIIVMILPPHSTHRLQPLDVSCFLALATAYSQEITNIMHISQGVCSMSKRMFWPLFKKAWEKSFTEKNIELAWEKTGIWPFNANRVLNEISPRPQTPPQDNASIEATLKTPYTSKAIRQFQKAYIQNPDKIKMRKLFKANETLAAQASIAEHRAKGLQQALQIEVKKR
jgi:hypothetical protein